ncbi:MAG: hypothetical protein EOP50_08745, partial [Sphingobacteriales bacterium]
MKKILRIAGYTAGTAILLAILVFVIAWKSPKYFTPKQRGQHPIVAFEKYTGEHPRPFIISRPQLVLFGGEHTRNPQDTQLALLHHYWKELKPTVALVEGRLGFLLPGVMDPVKTLGEGGAVVALAKDDDIPFYNWDLSKEELAGGLRQRFTPQQIALA